MSHEENTRYKVLLDRLSEMRAAACNQRKAKIVAKFLTSRRMLLDTYRSFDPEDMPVDLNRLIGDLEIQRNTEIDEAIDEIDSAFTVASRVVSEIAKRDPDFYNAVCEGTDGGSAFKMTMKSAPLTKVSGLASRDISTIIKLVSGSGQAGVTFGSIVSASSIDGAPKRRKLRRLLRYLRKINHIELRGAGRGATYRAMAGLEGFV